MNPNPGLRDDKYHFQEPVAALKERLIMVSAADKAAEAAVKRCWIHAGIGYIGGFLSIFLAAATGGLLAWLPVVLLIYGVVMTVKACRRRHYDIEDRKLAILRGFLDVISVDTPKTVAVEVDIDLRDYRKGGQPQGDPGADKDGSKVSRYTHDWLTVCGPLADGSRYRIKVVECFTRKEKSKRKYTKVRESIQGTVRLQVKAGLSRLGDPQALVQALKAKQPPAPLKPTRVEVKGDTLCAELDALAGIRLQGRYSTTEPEANTIIDAETLLNSMLWAYDGIARAAKPAGK